MSARLFTSDILFSQQILACAGFYDGPLNGKWKAPVDEAQEKFFSEAEKIKRGLGEFDQRTERNQRLQVEGALPRAEAVQRFRPRSRHGTSW